MNNSIQFSIENLKLEVFVVLFGIMLISMAYFVSSSFPLMTVMQDGPQQPELNDQDKNGKGSDNGEPKKPRYFEVKGNQILEGGKVISEKALEELVKTLDPKENRSEIKVKRSLAYLLLLLKEQGIQKTITSTSHKGGQ